MPEHVIISLLDFYIGTKRISMPPKTERKEFTEQPKTIKPDIPVAPVNTHTSSAIEDENIAQPESDKTYYDRSAEIWKKDYKSGEYAEAIKKYKELFNGAKENNASDEELADILSNWAWPQYYFDKNKKTENGETKPATAYNLAMQGIEKIKDLEEPKHDSMRSLFYLVAGLTKAYVVKEKGPDVETLFNQSLEWAKKSKDDERIGAATNGYGLYLVYEERYQEAIPHFDRAAEIQNKQGNKREAGHAHNNLAKCYNQIGFNTSDRDERANLFKEAINEADKALKLYNSDNDIDHFLSAGYRKSQSHMALGQFTEALKIYDSNIAIITNHPTLSKKHKEEKIKQQKNNIEKITTTTDEDVKNTGVIYEA